MKNSFANETNFLNPMEQDIEQIRKQLGKGMEIGEIADKLHLDREYAWFLFWFGIV